MKKHLLYLFLVLSLLLLSCTDKSDKVNVGLNVDASGTIDGVKSAVKDTKEWMSSEFEDISSITWADKKIILKPSEYNIISNDFPSSLNTTYKAITCDIESNVPIFIYSVPYTDLEKINQGLSFSTYPACSSTATTSFKCPESCNLPLDAFYVISNKENTTAEISVYIAYRYINLN